MSKLFHNCIRILIADKDDSILQNLCRILSPETADNWYKHQLKVLLEKHLEGFDPAQPLLHVKIECCQTESDVISLVKAGIDHDEAICIAFIGYSHTDPSAFSLPKHIHQVDPCVEIIIMVDAACFPDNHQLLSDDKILILEKPFHDKEIQRITSVLILKWLFEQAFNKTQAEFERRLEERTADHEKERRFIADVLEKAGALLVVLDRSGNIVRFNRACEEVSGVLFQDIRGKNFLEIFFSDKSNHILNDFNKLITETITHGYETYWNKGKRLIKWTVSPMTDDDQVTYWIWSGIDITDRNRIEEELRASEEGYRALIENVKDGVALIQNDHLRFANDSFLAMFGYQSLQDLMDKPILQMVHQDFTAQFRHFIRMTLDQKSWGVAFRGKCLKQTGEDFWAETFSSVIPYKGIPTILLTVRDITENMLWEQTMKQEAEFFRSETVRLKSSIGERFRLGNIIGKSVAMQKVYELIFQAAAADANVLILGKSGTGKELVAKAIHDMSARSENHFVPVNCSAIPETLIESEFFGYKKGAFTGASSDKNGFLQEADNGTLFLDEIGDISLMMQVKLLRVIEGGVYTPLGDNKQRSANLRIISAMNKDPIEMVRKGQMREDFFYRISVIPITLPALKDRKEDIPLLVEHFFKSLHSDLKSLPPHVMTALMNYDWPGNVRELQNVLQRYVTVKSLDFMKFRLEESSQSFSTNKSDELQGVPLQTSLDRYEKQILLQTLEKCKWNKTRTSECLGISRRGLFRRMQRLGL